jgi:hypothetical protein
MQEWLKDRGRGLAQSASLRPQFTLWFGLDHKSVFGKINEGPQPDFKIVSFIVNFPVGVKVSVLQPSDAVKRRNG